MNISDDFYPLTAILKIDSEKRLNIIQVLTKNCIINAAGTHGAASHQKAVFHTVGQAAGEVCRKRSVADIIEAVFPPAVGENGDLDIRTEKSCGKQHGVGSACYVDCAVRIPGYGLLKQFSHGVGIVNLRAQKNELDLEPAVLEILPEFLLRFLVGGDPVRADIHYALGTEHFHPEDIFQRPLVI